MQTGKEVIHGHVINGTRERRNLSVQVPLRPETGCRARLGRYVERQKNDRVHNCAVSALFSSQWGQVSNLFSDYVGIGTGILWRGAIELPLSFSLGTGAVEGCVRRWDVEREGTTWTGA